jgi:hypothetical protein
VSFARLLHRLFHGRAWLAFIVMGLATDAFSRCSLNVGGMLIAKPSLIRAYGGMAIRDGDLLQFVERAFRGYLALACFFVFKGCLDGLLMRVHRTGGAEKIEADV